MNKDNQQTYNIPKKRTKRGKLYEARVLPKEIRENPFAQLPIVKEKDLEIGLYNLINIGIIPKDTDIAPAFKAGDSIIKTTKMNLEIYVFKSINSVEEKTKYKNQVFVIDEKHPKKYKLDSSIINVNQSAIQKSKHDINPFDQSLVSKVNDFFLTAGIQDQNLQTSIEQQTDQNIQTSIQHQTDNITNLSIAESFNVPFQNDNIIENQLNLETQVIDSNIDEKSDYNKFKMGKRQIRIRILKGLIVNNSEMKYLKNQYTEIWGNTYYNLQKLSKICKKFDVAIMEVDGSQVAYYSRNQLYNIKEKDLLSCVLNQEVVNKLLPSKDKSIMSSMVKYWAIQKFREFIKIIKAKKVLKDARELYAKRKEMFQYITFWLKWYMHKKEIYKTITNRQNKYVEVMKNFKENWNTIKQGERYEIHICSYSLEEFQRVTMTHLNQRQNSQILRIFAIEDPNINIIYVVPENLQQEIASYLRKLFLIMHKEEYLQRIHFLTPENVDKLPQTLSLSKMLYYSPITLKTIKDIIKDKYAYIVPSVPNDEDKLIGEYLEAPLICGDLESLKKLRRKDYNRKLLKELDVPITLGEEDIFSEEELINKLTLLIIKNPQTITYYVKLNNEIDGRGIAQIHLQTVKYFSKLRKAVNYQFTEKRITKIRAIIEDVNALNHFKYNQFLLSIIFLIGKILLNFLHLNSIKNYFKQIKFLRQKYFHIFNGEKNNSFNIIKRKDFFQINNKNDIQQNFYQKKIIPLKLTPCVKTLFQNYYEFLKRVQEVGCVVEAVPTQDISGSSELTFKIDPDGEIKFIGSFDKIIMNDVNKVGVSFPSKLINSLDMNKLCRTIGEKVYSQNVWGYIKVDYIVFQDRLKDTHRNHKQTFFQIMGLDCMLDNYTSSYFLFDFLCKGQLTPFSQYIVKNSIDQQINTIQTNQKSGHEQQQIRSHANSTISQNTDTQNNQGFTSASQQQTSIEQKYYTYVPMIFHQGLADWKIKQFFSVCRDQKIAFDIQNKTGTIFILPGSLQHGMINILSISHDLKSSVSNIVESLNFLVSRFGEKIKFHVDKDTNRQDSYYLVDVLGSIRQLNKRLEN